MSNVQLIHGDCLEVMPTLPAQSVQMMFADLPYGVTSCVWDSQIDLNSFWAEIKRIAVEKANLALTATQPFASRLVQSNLKMFRYDLAYLKGTASGFLNANKMPLRAHESILIFYQKLPTYNPQKTAASKLIKRKRFAQSTSNVYMRNNYERNVWIETGERYPLSFLHVPSEKRQDSLHPTQKPVALLKWLIKTYTNPGDTVLDPVAGSGTTAIAAMRTGRKAICIEKDKGYYDIMVKRVADERVRMHQAEMTL